MVHIWDAGNLKEGANGTDSESWTRSCMSPRSSATGFCCLYQQLSLMVITFRKINTLNNPPLVPASWTWKTIFLFSGRLPQNCKIPYLYLVKILMGGLKRSSEQCEIKSNRKAHWWHCINEGWRCGYREMHQIQQTLAKGLDINFCKVAKYSFWVIVQLHSLFKSVKSWLQATTFIIFMTNAYFYII